LNYLINPERNPVMTGHILFCFRDCPFFQIISILSGIVLIMHLQSLDFNLKCIAAFIFQHENPRSSAFYKSWSKETLWCMLCRLTVIANESISSS